MVFFASVMHLLPIINVMIIFSMTLTFTSNFDNAAKLEEYSVCAVT